MKWLFIPLFTMGISVMGLSQEPRTNRPNSPNSTVNPSFDNNRTLLDTTASDTLPKTNTFKTLFKGKPGRAAFYSLIAPSGGQIYNKRWWKVPIAIGIDAGFTYNLIQKKKEYNSFNTIVNSYKADPKYISEYTQEQAINFRSATRGNVEYAWVYLVLGHLFTVFEAYVDRHLMEFDVSKDLSKTSPYIKQDLPHESVISIAYRF